MSKSKTELLSSSTGAKNRHIENAVQVGKEKHIYHFDYLISYQAIIDIFLAKLAKNDNK